MVQKVVLNGFGRMGRVIFTENYTLAEQVMTSTVNRRTVDLECFSIFKEPFVSLVDSYKKVQRKYYPEKDVFLSKIKKNAVTL